MEIQREQIGTLFAASILALVALSGCTQIMSSLFDPAPVAYSDHESLMENVLSCTPAEFIETVPVGSIEHRIQGVENGACRYEAQALYAGLEDEAPLSMTCSFPAPYASAFARIREFAGAVDLYCEGSLAELGQDPCAYLSFVNAPLSGEICDTDQTVSGVSKKINQAVDSRNIAACDRFAVEVERDTCRARVAYSAKEASLCAAIENEGQLVECEGTVSLLQTGVQVCQNREPGGQRDGCLFTFGTAGNLLSACEAIDDISIRENCLVTFVAANNQSELCERITDFALKAKCASLK